MKTEIAEDIKKKRNKNKEVYIGVSILSILLIGVLFLLFAPEIIAQKKIAEIKAKGDPVSMKDLAKIKIPDDQNGAVIYEKIFTSIPKEMDEFDSYRISDKYGIDWNENKNSFFSLKQEIAKYDKPLSLLDKASALPKCRFKNNWEDGIDKLEFKQFAKIRDIARILRLRAELKSCDGKMNDAILDVGRIFKLSDASKEEPILIGQLVRYAIISIGRRAFVDVVYRGNINEKQARELDSVISKIDISNSCLTALKGERANTITQYDEFYKSPGTQIYYFDEIYYLDKVQEMIEDSSKSVTKELLNKKNPEESIFHVISSMYLIDNSGFRKKKEIVNAMLLGCRIFLGLQVYEDRYGAYPENLNLLKTKLNWPVAKDPFGNKDFIYKKSAKGFLLYSIGPNFKDDGGLDINARKKGSENYDISWNVEK